MMSKIPKFSNLCAERIHRPCVRSAFSLIEMLVVIAIIGLLAALVVGGASHFRETSVRARVQTELNQVVVSLGLTLLLKEEMKVVKKLALTLGQLVVKQQLPQSYQKNVIKLAEKMLVNIRLAKIHWVH